MMQFDIKKSEDILQKCEKLFKENGVVIRITRSKENIKSDLINIIDLFSINKEFEPIYTHIVDLNSLEDVNNELKNNVRELREKIKNIIDNLNGFLNENAKVSANAIFKSLANFEKVLTKQISKVGKNPDETLEEVRIDYKNKFRKILSERLIKNIISAIYEGLKNDNIGNDEYEFYKNTLECINNFMSLCGVYTLIINVNEEVDFDFTEVIDTVESDNYISEGRIKSIKMYPYAFNDEEIICDGQVIVWR
ncbi:hypothetical protein P5F43_15500 [Clostridium perfringens]|uniref:Uncharacterized protein n=1 Tax=Clostridium perfringens TaxID=1502 RepID=A0AAW9I9C2_CLOPF|nr:hypothetical protein [Clostridium perfringens]MBI5999347.1 hypothetical protein [Clostridium perfringens]MBI6108309.1 hypothetical protein [Clostridium perfringens]MDB2060244.1 hypothetical protein [Clostridium perfringens]MDB2062106.1 hypothetical protein [Clostridium perfringens]MDB2064898.1 hypothetical protein [Clostridium perfringens]